MLAVASARASRTESGSSGRPAPAKACVTGGNSQGAAVARCRAAAPGVPSNEIRPVSITITRSASAKIRAVRCSATTTVTPRSRLMRVTSASSSSAATGSSWLVGSSSSSSRWPIASTEAIATRCCSPPDIRAVSRSARCEAPAAARASSSRVVISTGGQPRFSSPNATSWSARRMTSCDSGSWNTNPARRAIAPGRCSRVSSPPLTTRPDSRPPWKWGTRPSAARSSVDLPQPDSPSSSTIWPSSTASVIPSSAGEEPSG